MTITALQAEDSVVFTAISDLGELLDANQCRRLFDLPGAVTGSVDDAAVAKDLASGLSDAERPIFEELNGRNGRWFDLEIEKLERDLPAGDFGTMQKQGRRYVADNYDFVPIARQFTAILTKAHKDYVTRRAA